MKHLISCDCGSFRGEIIDCTAGVSAVCYCKDCQMFAAYLGKTDDVLDPSGGTEVVGLRHSNIGLIHNCIEGASSDLEKSFGSVKLRINTNSTEKPVKTLKPSLSLVAQYLLSITKQFVSKRYKSSPFFNESGEPLLEVEVLTKEQRQKLSNAV